MNRVRLFSFMLGVGIVATSPMARAADNATALAALRERVESSLAVYKEQSARIADEKIPLIREINRLEDENILLRESVENSLRLTADNNKSFDALRNQLEERRAQSNFSQRFLQEYLDAFESRIHIAEDQHFKDRLTQIRKQLDAPGNAAAKFASYFDAAELGLDRLETAIGGYRFEGKAIAPGGVVTSGTVAVLGPAAYFSGANGAESVAGVLQFHVGTIEPAIAVLGPPYSQSIADFVQGRGSVLPLDASAGNAVGVESANVKIVDHISQGGPVGYAILLLGGIALLLSAIKFYDLVRFRSIDSRLLGGIVREARRNNEEAALAEARKVSGPVGEMLELGVRNIRANSVLLEELMLSVILRKRPEVERYLPFLAITTAAAPLLGLLGTVTGMIRTFALITVFGSSDPRLLSGGISEALVTTELGLMVAVPTLVLHGIFTRMIKSRFGDMERVAFEFVKTISIEETKPAAK